LLNERLPFRAMVLAAYAVRRRYPVLGAVLAVLAVAVFGVMVVASGFLAIVLLLLCSAMDELSPAEGSAGPLGTIAGPLCFMNSTPRQAEIRRAPAVKREAEEDWGKARGR
jgi:NADH:ubiquinone oxidoreductase subunit H